MGQGGKERKKAAQAAASQTPKTKLSHRDKLVKDVSNTGKRLTRLGKKLAKLPPELAVTFESNEYEFTVPGAAAAEVAAKALDSLAGQIAALPADWKPTSKRGRPGLVVDLGDVVQIREKNAPKYADMVPPNTDLTVTKIGAALIEVQYGEEGSTTKVCIPRGHLMLKPKEVQA